MNLQYNFQRNNRGIGTVFAMVFFLLIVMVVFASFVIILSQNTGLEQTTINAKQMDLNRYTELQTVSIANPETAVLSNKVYIQGTITNNGTLPTEFVRLWIRDITNNTVGNILLNPSIVIQPGSSVIYFKSVPVLNASSYDQFSFWFVTTRGNLISAYPDINQFNGLVPTGTFPGVTAINSTYQTNQNNPLQLSLNTTKPNQLIYVVVSFDDGNSLSAPTSNPSLTWTLRGTSSATDHYHGDSILKTFYAIDPSVGPITINIKSTADELSDYYCSAMAFAISDVNTTAPFPFDGLAQTSIGESTMVQDSINVRYSNELVIGAIGIDDLNPAITPGVGFGEIMPVQSSYGASGEPDSMPRSVWSEWAIAASPINNLSVNCSFTSTKDWAIIIDAVKLVVIPPTAPVSLSPVIGPIGQIVTVSGQGFAANSPLIATFDGSQIPFSFTTDGSGNIPQGATFTVPQGATAGVRNVTIIDSKFDYASANFTVTTPKITLTPNTGPVGTAVTVTGSNFIGNSNLNISFDGNPVATSPYPLTANANGNFSATFNFNFNDSAGAKQVLVSDGFNSASTNFAVTSTITLSPTNGIIGSPINVFGYGFGASQPVTVTFAGSTVIPGSVTTDAFGFFNASFTTITAQTAGAKTVTATDNLLNAASALFTITPSISLNPTIGNAGSSVTVSGMGFAATKTITATFAGSSVTLSGTTSTDGTGSFSSAAFTVPTSTQGGAQTVIIKDASSNSASAVYTVNTLIQRITVAMSNSAPSATVTINGGYPSSNQFGADGNPHDITMVAGAPFTLSFSNSANTRNGFNVSSAFSATSSSYTASTNTISLTAYEQVQNTFSATINYGNPPSGDALVLTGTYLNTPATIITTLNVGSRASASNTGWSDYNTPVTFPAISAISGGTGYTNERWSISNAYSTAPLTAGGNTYTQTYYHQYSFQLDYAVLGSGAPTAPTLTATQFGTAYTPTLGSSLVSYWLDSTQSWRVTNPLGGSGSTERWSSRSTVSGTVSSSSPITAGNGITFNFYHQYLLTVTGGNGVNYGTASPTGDNWYDDGMSTTVSSNGVYSRASGTGQRVSSWQIDSGTANNVATTGTVTTSSVLMSAAHTVTFALTTQYLLTVTGGNGVTYGTSSAIAGDIGWYDNGMSTTVSSNWVWGTSGSTRTSLSNWNLDGGSNQNPTRANSGTITTSPVTMSTAHTVNLISTTQYYLTVTGGNSLTFGTASPTSDQWYDSGTSTTVSSNWVWNVVIGQSRTAISNYAIDASNKNPARSNTGTLTTSSVLMTTYHTVSFSSITQYYLTVSGGNAITYGTASQTSDNWYDSVSSTTVNSNGVWSRAGGSGQRAASWNLDGGSNTALSSISTVTTASVSMTTYHTVNFNAVTQYQVTLDSGATSALSSITSPTVLGDNYWYDTGTSVTLALNGVYGRSGGSGTRITGYAVNGGSNNPVSTTGTFTVLNAVSMSALEAITTTKVTQYQVTLDAVSISALNSISGPTVIADNYWYDSGTSVSVVFNGVWGQGGGTGTRLSGYIINGGSNNPTSTSGTVTVFSGAISNHEFVTATSVIQYQVTFTTFGLGAVTASTKVVNIGGTDFTYNQLPYQNWFDSGTTYTYYSAVASSTLGTQFALTGTSPTSPISGTTGATVTGTYKTQYLVTFAQNNVGADFAGTVITVDGLNYDRNGAGVYLDIGSHTFAFRSPLYVSISKAYKWVSTTGLVTTQSGSITISTIGGSVTGNYQTSTPQNLISNPGFETNNAIWTSSYANGGSVSTRNGGEQNGGSYSGRTRTTSTNTNTQSYASLIQTLTSTYITEVPGNSGTLTAWIFNSGSASSGYSSVELKIFVTNTTGTYVLHYVWNATSAPSDSSTDKYIYMGPIDSGSNVLTQNTWVQFSTNLLSDLNSKGLSSGSLQINQIELRSNGYDSASHDYGQTIYWDDLSLIYVP